LLLRRRGRKIGFVPTMGFLHEGHLSLVRQAKKDNDIVIVSIFVNSLQFAPGEDFHKYPRDLKRDQKLLKGLCDILFVPSHKEMYPDDFCSFVEVRGLGDRFCGLTRKGHFVGVTTVVAKLFGIVCPDRAYFGQKDAQQVAIVQKMVKDLNFPLEIKVMPIVRQPDGLALSSRNVYLSTQECRDAVVLYQSLTSAKRMAESGIRDTAKIKSGLIDLINRTSSSRIDYIEIVDQVSFEPLKQIEKEALLILAVYIGRTRLIDNMALKVKLR